MSTNDPRTGVTHREDVIPGDPRSADTHGAHIDSGASPRTIEKQIDAKRADIDRTLNALEQQFSPSQMVDRGMGLVRDNGGEVMQNMGRQFRDNPIPFLLTGLGMVWAMSSSAQGGKGSSVGHYRSRYGYDDDHRGRDFDDREVNRTGYTRGGYDDYEASRARVMMRGSGSDFTPRYTDGSLPSTTGAFADGMHDDDDDGFLDSVKDGFDKLGNRLADMKEDLSGKVSDMSDEARRRYESMSDEARNRYDEGRQRYAAMDADARTRYHETRVQVRRKRDDWQRGMRDGMDSMRAYGRDAGQRARHQARSSADDVAGFVQEQPMVAGALGMAVGALIGALLPSTRTENRYLGEYADEAKRQARSQAESGMERVREEAEGGIQQLRGSVEDVAGTAREKIEQAASDARAKGKEALDEADRKASPDGKGTGTPSNPKSGTPV